MNKAFGFNRFIFPIPLAMLCVIILGVSAVPLQAIAQTAEPLVAIHVSELTNALDPDMQIHGTIMSRMNLLKRLSVLMAPLLSR